MNLESEPITLKHPFHKSIALTLIFLVTTPIIILLNLIAMSTLGPSIEKASPQKDALAEYSNKRIAQVYAAQPGDPSFVSGKATSADARLFIVQNYLEKYNSPLTSHAGQLVSAADEYGIDFRLLTAIAQQESNLCKKIPPDTYNCWGWGIHSEGTLGFDSFSQGIQIVSKGIRTEYIDKGYETPEQIMTKYTPLSNGSWAEGVETFMLEME